MKFTIGLTGGVASGKSLVAALFRGHGIDVIDADQVARDVVVPGTQGLQRVVAHFGAEVLDDSGALDRRRMRERVFANDGERRALERILHPLIQAELARRRDLAAGPYNMLMVPLLAKTGMMRALVDRVLAVDTAEALQLERLQGRDGISPALARAMIAAQESRADRLAVADDVLTNDGAAEALEKPVAALHRQYLHLARAE